MIILRVTLGEGFRVRSLIMVLLGVDLTILIGVFNSLNPFEDAEIQKYKRANMKRCPRPLHNHDSQEFNVGIVEY